MKNLIYSFLIILMKLIKWLRFKNSMIVIREIKLILKNFIKIVIIYYTLKMMRIWFIMGQKILNWNWQKNLNQIYKNFLLIIYLKKRSNLLYSLINPFNLLSQFIHPKISSRLLRNNLFLNFLLEIQLMIILLWKIKNYFFIFLKTNFFILNRK